MPDLSIIIVTYNSAKDIVPCLDSIERTKGDLNIEIIVVDNDSEDDTVEIVRLRYPYVYLIANSYNTGFPTANNQAIALAKGQSILLLNPDTVLGENALNYLVSFLKDNAQPVIVGLNLRNQDGSFQSSIRRLPSLQYILVAILGLDDLFPRSGFFNGFRYSGTEPSEVRTVGSVSGAALAFSRPVLDVLKGLDTELFYYEDVDLCARAWKNNIPVYFLPDARVMHLGGQSEASNKTRVIFQTPQSRIGYFKKHHSYLTYLVVRLITVMELLFRLTVRVLQSCLPGRFGKYGSRIRGYAYALGFALFGMKPNLK